MRGVAAAGFAMPKLRNTLARFHAKKRAAVVVVAVFHRESLPHRFGFSMSGEIIHCGLAISVGLCRHAAHTRFHFAQIGPRPKKPSIHAASSKFANQPRAPDWRNDRPFRSPAGYCAAPMSSRNYICGQNIFARIPWMAWRFFRGRRRFRAVGYCWKIPCSQSRGLPRRPNSRPAKGPGVTNDSAV